MKRFVAALALILPLAAHAGIDEGLQAAATGDYKTAFAEIQPLAEKGDVDAQYYIGYFYHYGYGGKKSDAEAAKWFLKAANQGDPRAQAYLGRIYEKSAEIKRDLIAAHMWFSLATKNPKAQYRDALYNLKELGEIEKKMKPEEIAKAKEMAQNWKPVS